MPAPEITIEELRKGIERYNNPDDRPWSKALDRVNWFIIFEDDMYPLKYTYTLSTNKPPTNYTTNDVKRAIRNLPLSFISIWDNLKTLEGKALKTIAQKKSFQITSVDSNKVIIDDGKRTLYKKHIESGYRQLVKDKKLDLERARSFDEFSPVYILAILGTFNGITKVKKGRKWILEYNHELNSVLSDFSTPDELDLNQNYFEGAVKEVQVNSYERNPKARSECINHFGAICKVCELDFEKVYGTIGKGFIHVHHLKEISEVKKEYKVNPIKDLVPVCPNCHAMLHKKKPAYTVDEMKSFMN